MTHVYDAVEELAGSLAEADFALHAEGLRGALSEGATGTEIFMILQSRLSGVVDDEVVPRRQKDEAERLRDIVIHALK
ncbi:hypothetical protein [Paraburkholderia strydomiana]|uniref:hypothetical protein n=1 Tax=Paraburkholderia strydomiana TaxID=1245417 RepID=UPI002854AE53|nr:hypothetical protein [Paraburkholderia strydomiana]MDR7009327.1 hypothetical protein [Paraburkholderia strydomiana]